jgi:hypothetical protein
MEEGHCRTEKVDMLDQTNNNGLAALDGYTRQGYIRLEPPQPSLSHILEEVESE